MRLYGPAQPSTSDAALYTATAETKITQIHACNTAAATASLRIDINATAAANRIFPDYDLASKAIVVWEGKITLVAGDTIRGKQGTSGAITVTIEGRRA